MDTPTPTLEQLAAAYNKLQVQFTNARQHIACFETDLEQTRTNLGMTQTAERPESAEILLLSPETKRSATLQRQTVRDQLDYAHETLSCQYIRAAKAADRDKVPLYTYA